MSLSAKGEQPAAGILDGVRIVDFTQMKAGPMGTQILADLGADVIKMERASVGEWERRFASFGRFTPGGQSAFFLAMNRNKRSLALDLKAPEAKEIIHGLVTTADVLVQNFRPCVLVALGFGYDDLRAIKPDIIYCSNSGYGQSGPYVDRPGQDLLAQAISGIALIERHRRPPRPRPIASSTR